MVNTNGREDLIACLEAIERTHPPRVEHEVLVLDNASDDGSADAVRERFPEARLFALERRAGKAENDSALLRESRGRYCLLLNEDSELREGAARALVDALERDPGAAAAGAQLLTSAGEPTACAWRLPDAGWALAAAVFLHDRYAVQSRGDAVREVGWVQSSAMLVRREAAERVGWLDPDFFVYSDETDFCKRLHDAGWRILFVPRARAVHHDQLSTDAAAMRRRIVEFHRNRDLYFRKHGMPVTRALWRVCWTWALPRARRRGGGAAGPRPAPLPPPRAPAADAGPRRGHSRGGRRLQRAAWRPPAGLICAPVEHADTAQLAAVGGALAAVLVLLARGRFTLLAGFVLLAVSEAGLTLSLGTGPLDSLSSAGGAAAGVLGLVVLGGAAALLARRPALVPIAVLLAAPFRPPIQFDATSEFIVSIADDGRLGRLLPLYFVLLAAVLALGWRALRGKQVRALPPVIAYPAAAFFAFAMVSLLWADDVEAGTNLIAFFTLPFAALLATVARADFPDFVPRALAAVGIGARHGVRAGRALAGGHARAVLLRAQPRGVERQLGLLPRDLAVRRPEPLRAPRGARDRDSARAAGHAALAHVAAGRAAGGDVGGAACSRTRSRAWPRSSWSRWRSPWRPGTGACGRPWACWRWWR